MEDLKDKIDIGQFGGQAGVGTEHMIVCYIDRTSQAEQGHTRVPSSPCPNWTQSIQQSSNLLDLFY